MKVDILAIGVHPDDTELSCSGYLLKEIAAGRSVALLDLTLGELGTRGNAALRKKEALLAAKKLGAVSRTFLNIGDGLFESNEKILLQIIQVIRKLQPSIVLTNALEDRHPDHARAAAITARAAFLAGLKKILTKEKGQIQAASRPIAVYHYIQDYALRPDVLIDISDQMEQKMELIKIFKSQFFDPNSKEAPSPISSADFLEYQLAKARVFGRYLQVSYAEGFNVSRPIGVRSLLDLY